MHLLSDEFIKQYAQCAAVQSDALDDDETEEPVWGCDPFEAAAQLEEELGAPLVSTRCPRRHT